MYAIQMTVNGRQVPTFYLDENVQGIVSEDHARDIACAMVGAINPQAGPDKDALSITAVKV